MTGQKVHKKLNIIKTRHLSTVVIDNETRRMDLF